MGAFDPKYTDEQREAIARTYQPHKVSQVKVAELARSGQLKDHRGENLDPFEVNPTSVRKIWERERARSLGQVPSPLANLEPKDSIEAMRRRLVNVCDSDLRLEERKRPGKRDYGKLKEIASAMKILASIPGPKDAKPAMPKLVARSEDKHGVGGLAGAIFQAARNETAQNDPPPMHVEGEDALGAEPGYAIDVDDDAQAQDATLPGSRTSDLPSAVLAAS